MAAGGIHDKAAGSTSARPSERARATRSGLATAPFALAEADRFPDSLDRAVISPVPFPSPRQGPL